MANELNHANHDGISFTPVGTELHATVTGGGTPILETVGATVKLVYRSANTRWEYPDGTVPDLTGRLCSIVWEGTSAQIPTEGTGGTDFQEGDTALIRSTSL